MTYDIGVYQRAYHYDIEKMKMNNTVKKANRLIIMLARELFLTGDIDTAVILTGMSAACITMLGNATVDQVDDLINGITILLFTPRLSESELAILLEIPLDTKYAYALTVQKTPRKL